MAGQEKPFLEGWILLDALPQEEAFLKDLGIELSCGLRRYDEDIIEYRAKVPLEAMVILEEHWGRFYWFLK